MLCISQNEIKKNMTCSVKLFHVSLTPKQQEEFKHEIVYITIYRASPI